jgi:hypothetical protein
MLLRTTSFAAVAIAAFVLLGSSAGPSHAWPGTALVGAINKMCSSSLTARLRCAAAKAASKLEQGLRRR